jgi:hypothetical protein
VFLAFDADEIRQRSDHQACGNAVAQQVIINIQLDDCFKKVTPNTTITMLSGCPLDQRNHGSSTLLANRAGHR